MSFRRFTAFSAEAYLRRHFPDAREFGDERRLIECLACGAEKLHISVRKGIWHCFRCDAKGTMFEFIKMHLGVDDAGAFKIMEGFAEPPPPWDPAEFAKKMKPSAAEAPRPAEAAMPEGYRPLPLGTVMGRAAWEYLTGRGVTPEQIATHRIGVATRGKLVGCVILPVMQDGRLAFWVGRKFLRSGHGNKYLNPKNGETPLTASEVLFNIDVAPLFGRVTLVEGYFDALGEGRTGVALLGKVLHAPQLWVLNRSVRPDVPITVKLDEDVALSHSMETARMLSDAGFRDVTVERTIGDPAQKLGSRGSEPYTFENLIASKVGGKT